MNQNTQTIIGYIDSIHNMLRSKLRKDTQAIIRFFCLLTERERIILLERIGRGKTLIQVAKQFDMTDVRIKRIEDNLIGDIESILDRNI